MARFPKTASIQINRQRAESLVTQLMAIPGRSTEEAEVSAFIVKELLRAGIPKAAIQYDSAHKRSHLGGQVGNLIVKLPGSFKAPRRLLMAHLDTVPICVGSSPRRRGRRVVSGKTETALGADNRAGGAAVLVAALEIVERKLPHPPMTLLWTVQEEVGLVGARHVALRKLGRPRMAFNFDGAAPTEVVIGATGANRLSIRIQGVASHAGVHPERGVSAITVAALAIARLEKEGWHGAVKRGRLRGTSNVGFINGGQTTNVVTDSVSVRAEVRSHDRRFRERMLEAYRRAFKEAAGQVRNDEGRHARVRFEVSRDYESFCLTRTEPCVTLAAQAIRDLGKSPSFRVVDGGLDANWMNAHGLPTVSLGVGQRNIHTVEESLDLDQFHTGCRVALYLATNTDSPR